MARPKVVVVCGSTRFIELMAICGWLIETQENAIALNCHLLPSWWMGDGDHFAERDGVADAMDTLHLQKIDLADEVFVVDWDGYVGASTQNEISHAKDTHTPIRYLSKTLIYMSAINEKLARDSAKADEGK